MQQRGWKELGRELRSFREAQDLPQKSVVDLSGEIMGERTLRAYESGEQRPSRDRLLKLLLSAFQIKDALTINRCLKLAKYAGLIDREIAEHGLSATSDQSSNRRADGRLGAPADFHIEVSTLVVTDGQGRELWRHEFPTPFEPSAYDGQAVKKCSFGDIDGDGHIETLFVSWPRNFGSVGSTLFCLADDGSLKWQFDPGRAIRDTRQEYLPPYFISNVRILQIPKAAPRILVSSNHYLHNPNQIAILDAAGNLISEYWHSGHLLYVASADINGDGVEEVLLAGVNNGYRRATMVVFDPRNISGASSQPGRQILEFLPGTEKAVVLFPKTCLSQDSPYNRVGSLHVTRERRIMLAVVEGVSEARNPGVMIYELDFKLNVLSARPDSHLQEAHRLQEVQGTLNHSWTEEENERLKGEVAIRGGV